MRQLTKQERTELLTMVRNSTMRQPASFVMEDPFGEIPGSRYEIIEGGFYDSEEEAFEMEGILRSLQMKGLILTTNDGLWVASRLAILALRQQQ